MINLSMLKQCGLISIFLIGLLFQFPTPATEENTSTSLEPAFALLRESSFAKTQEAIDLIIASGDKRVLNYLQALLNGKLYYHKAQGNLVIIKGDSITDAHTDALLEQVQKTDFKKITTNNKLRKYLRTQIAQLNLTHPKVAVRLEAAHDMLGKVTPEMAITWRTLLKQEANAKVREVLELGIAITEMTASDKAVQLAAIATVSGQVHPAVRTQLTILATDTDLEIATAAKATLEKIELKIQWYRYLETLFFGISLGSVLVLVAIGLAITFGVMGVINMAHGELMMLGAYTTYLVQQWMPQAIDYSLWVAIPAAFIMSGFMGILIERIVIRHLYGRPLETLLATFGISLILQQLVRTVISPQNVPVSNPAWMSGSVEINSILSLTLNRLYIILFCFLVFLVLYFILRKSRLGLQVRAISQNRTMAQAMGIPVARVDALTFGLGAGIAGVAGVALSQLTNVGPNLGQSYIIDSFMVVVFGGVGNLWGTLVAGLSLGVANKLLEPWAGAVLAKIVVLIFIILFIQKRPSGLFPQQGRAAEV